MDGRTTSQDSTAAADERTETPAVRTTADPWRAFLDPDDGSAFLAGWLAIAGDRIASAQAGVLFLRGDAGRLGIAALWHLGAEDTDRFVTLAEAVLRKPEPWAVRELTRNIDKLPLRQQEVRDRRDALRQ